MLMCHEMLAALTRGGMLSAIFRLHARTAEVKIASVVLNFSEFA